MSNAVENIFGPRVPMDEFRAHRGRYLLPSVMLALAGSMLVASLFLPYWKMTLHAPQYPKGLHVSATLTGISGDVNEIDGLNHYIGMRPLREAAQFEKANAVMLIGAVATLLLAAMLIHNRWAALLALPTVLFPLGFLLDLQYWLATFGTNLDPKAALSSSIKPFIPPVLGVGTIGQFKTVAVASDGLWLAAAASFVALVALWFHRRAYKPLVDAQSAARGRVSEVPHVMA